MMRVTYEVKRERIYIYIFFSIDHQDSLSLSGGRHAVALPPAKSRRRSSPSVSNPSPPPAPHNARETPLGMEHITREGKSVASG